MAQAEHQDTRFDPARDSHAALSDEALHRLTQVGEALSAIAELADAGAAASTVTIARQNLASLFRLLAATTAQVVDEAPYLVH